MKSKEGPEEGKGKKIGEQHCHKRNKNCLSQPHTHFLLLKRRQTKSTTFILRQVNPPCQELLRIVVYEYRLLC